jgi:hypothetical protein
MIAASLTFVRDAAWLDAARARAWCRVLASVSAAIVLAYLAVSHRGVDPFGKPVGTDFISFYTAARLASAGHVASVYDPAIHAAAQRALLPDAGAGYAAFFYPPTFLLLLLPLAVLSYLPALASWLVVSLAALVLALRRLLPPRWAILPTLTFPGVLLNAGHGQNGFVTAACMGWSVTLAGRRPFLAGLCLGTLVIKPQLALAAPVALIAARRWRMLAGAVTAAVGMTALSWLLLGEVAWQGFLDTTTLARKTLEQGLVEPWKMVSLFAAVRLLHGGVGLAYALQIGLAVVVCLLLGHSAARRPGASAEIALLIIGNLLCTPFLLDYDLVCLIVPLVWMTAQTQPTGWHAWEKLVLLAAYVLPVVTRQVAHSLGVPLAPMVLLALLLVVARRVARPSDMAV